MIVTTITLVVAAALVALLQWSVRENRKIDAARAALHEIRKINAARINETSVRD